MSLKDLNLPAKRVKVLCVGLRKNDRCDDPSLLLKFFEGTRFGFVFVETLEKAKKKLANKIPFAVILTERYIGREVSWKDVLRISGKSKVVVAYRRPSDELWLEVLKAGGYNLIHSRDLQERETCRTLVMAGEDFKNAKE